MKIEEIGLRPEEATNLKSQVQSEVSQVRKVGSLLGRERFPYGIHNAKIQKIERPPKPKAGGPIKVGPIKVNDRNVVPFVEVAIDVEIQRDQMDASDKSALKDAIVDAAHLFAIAMDTLLLNGQENVNDAKNKFGVLVPTSCDVKHGHTHDGLLGGGLSVPQKIVAAVPSQIELIQGIMAARAKLRGQGHEPPHTLILSQDLHQAAVTPTPNLQLPITTIKELLNENVTAQDSDSTSKIVDTAAMPMLHAILFRPTEADIAYAYDGELQLLTIGPQIALRIFGEFALRIRNETAIVAIEYKQ